MSGKVWSVISTQSLFYVFGFGVNKPRLIDFTGWACVNCRKMEENAWRNEKTTKASASVGFKDFYDFGDC
jgi:thiol:disulfide interchange protein